MKRLLYVNPSYTKQDVLQNVRVLALPPLSLVTLAARTPPHWQPVIFDEAAGPVDAEAPADLVALTCMTPLAPRAYDIAARFRRRGIPVVMGGIHASMMPEEALAHVDSVVVGEGDEIWETVIADVDRGALARRYVSPTPSLERLPSPRRDLLGDGYFIETLQTSRGCPHDCSFCSVTRFNGGRHRLRPLPEVLREIFSLSGRRFFFLDDNLVGDGPASLDRARALFRELCGQKKRWGAQVCLSIVEDEALLRAASAAGARFFFIGFESIAPAALLAMRKRVNLRPATCDLSAAIRKIQDHGIAVVGGFIFGGDEDGPDVFDRTVEFVEKTGIDAAQFTVLTPFPGTRLLTELEAQERILARDFPRDWQRYNGFEVVFRPRRMTVEQLAEGHARAYRDTASLSRSLARGARTFLRTKSPFATMSAYAWNYDCGRAVGAKRRTSN